MSYIKKDRRSKIRVPLLSERCSWDMKGLSYMDNIADITTTGLFIETDNLIPPRSLIQVNLTLPADLGILTLPAEVRRVVWRGTKKVKRGFGCEFLEIGPNNEKILDAYVTYLRNKQIISVSKRIIDEFFGNQKR